MYELPQVEEDTLIFFNEMKDQLDHTTEQHGELKTVFKDGGLLVEMSLAEIRNLQAREMAMDLAVAEVI